MARLIITSVICLSFIGVAMIPNMTSASPKPSCCSPLSDCMQGLQKKSCCLSDSQTTPPTNLNSAQILAPAASQARYERLVFPKWACGEKKSDDTDPSSDDETSLYLRIESFLI